MIKFVWVGLIVGTIVGQIIPSLWGADMFSMSTNIFSFLGGAVGLWLGFKADRALQ